MRTDGVFRSAFNEVLKIALSESHKDCALVRGKMIRGRCRHARLLDDLAKANLFNLASLQKEFSRIEHRFVARPSSFLTRDSWDATSLEPLGACGLALLFLERSGSNLWHSFNRSEFT